MGDILPFRMAVPASRVEEGDDADDQLIADAYKAAQAAAERYERERRQERELRARVEALTRENARLKAELARRGRTSSPSP
jgi:predicted RNase H-like nuclease (RuvC/YqgF family)